MQNRGFSMSNSSKTSSSFSTWIEQQRDNLEEGLESTAEFGNSLGSFTFFNQFSAIQENFTTQIQELSGSIPEAGPLSASFRQRMTHSIYLLIASGVFAILAVLIGLPSIFIRPTKFVVCLSLSTLLSAASVVVMQKPSVFLANIMKGEISQTAPFGLLIISLIFTLYVAIFIHKYIYVLIAGAFQILSLLFYLSTFIPGGKKGLVLLLKTSYVVVSTAMKPCLYVCKKTLAAILTRIFGS